MDGKEVEKPKQRVVQGSVRPKDGEGFTWRPVHGDQYNRKRITGWGRVSTVPDNLETEMAPGPINPNTEAVGSIVQTRLPEPAGKITPS